MAKQEGEGGSAGADSDQKDITKDSSKNDQNNDDVNVAVEVTLDGGPLLDLGGRESLEDVLEKDNLSAIEAADNSSDQEEELLSVDEATVSRLMREQDADLLDSMHYASSQVSRYSPGGTPLVRPAEKSLPAELDDLPMLSEAALPASCETRKALDEDFGKTLVDEEVVRPQQQQHHHQKGGGRAMTMTTSFSQIPEESILSNSALRHPREASSDAVTADVAATPSPSSVLFSSTSSTTAPTSSDEPSSFQFKSLSLLHNDEKKANESDGEIVNQKLQKPLSASEQQQRRFRRCLSGELRAVPPNAGEDPKSNNSILVLDEESLDEDVMSVTSKTRTSPMSGAQEYHHPPGSSAPTSPTKKPLTDAEREAESHLAKQRRMNEAMQFAEAVGEMIPIRQDELRIIEDNSEGDQTDDESDNEDGSIEAKEINVLEEFQEVHQQDTAAMTPPKDVTIDAGNQGQLADKQQQPQQIDSQPQPSQPPPVPQREHVVPSSHVKGATLVRQTSDYNGKRKSRPVWPFGPAGKEPHFVDKLSDGFDKSDFVYKGISANPPEITKRGIQRGNYAQLHRKAWLEVSDKYHRYGKNLRLYYRHWESIGYPTNEFFDWLDSKGEAAGQPLPNLEDCPRSVLDADTVLYILNPEVTDGYFLEFISTEDGRGRVIDVDGDPVQTGPDGWIFVLRDNKMYGAQKVTSVSGHSKQRFHHSSFFGGKAVASAGIIITDDEGYLDRLYPHSGHYRPGESHMQRMLYFVHKKGVDLRTFKVDTQQFRRVARDKENKSKDKDGKKADKGEKGEKGEKDKEEKKAKKIDSLHLEKAVNVACFLAHKAGFIGHGVFNCIHKIRKADVTSVTEALEAVDDGGYWAKKRRESAGQKAAE